ncbi:MAG: xanthine dehydrogenase molybdopterin binding subunit [Planctomycetota bacterium]
MTSPRTGPAIPHESAIGHVTGTADYIEDLPRMADELIVGFVGAPFASGTLIRIDTEAARKTPGVVAVLTASDLPESGARTFGPIFHDEPFLVDSEVDYLDQPVVVIAAENEDALKLAQSRVVIDGESKRPVLEIDDAIEQDRYLGPTREIARGDAERALRDAPHQLHGTFYCNGQEQFYLESQATRAIPEAGGLIRVISSTQNPTESQAVVAEVLGLPLHQVVCECPRMGGGFGGKETQGAIPAAMAAWVAQRTGRAARIVYDKTTDMCVTGKRHATKAWYRAGYNDQGDLLALDIMFVSNGGAYADLSTSVMERTMLHADNAYYIPDVRIIGKIAKTNLPPNTAFRGFGGPQGVVAIETILQDIAQKLDQDAFEIRRRNVYGHQTRNVTPYGQIVRNHVLPELFDDLAKRCDYRQRMERVEQFNAQSKTHLKGLAMTAIKFGISFTTRFLNQGNALVNVYTDGTVQVSTGGTEMGQGLNTKIKQLVAEAFAIEPDAVRLMTTSTEKNHNTSPTAASAGTDLNGSAAVNACEQIKERMRVYAAELLADQHKGHPASADAIRFENGELYDARDPEKRVAFGAFCDLARRARVDLGARGFYATPGVDFNRETGKGSPFFYYTTGVAAAEVTIDRFTGDLSADRCDVLMDIGRMINPGIDLGQLYGGFIQGMGWSTTEELVYSPSGELLSKSPTTYKVPNATDTPAIFNVDTYDNPKHTINVRMSKAVGEPPLMLGIAPFLACRHALSFIDRATLPPLDLPATNEALLMSITKLVGQQQAQATSPIS